VRPSALDEEASGAPLHHALWAIERPLRSGCCCPYGQKTHAASHV
jgi:hypothetical protein